MRQLNIPISNKSAAKRVDLRLPPSSSSSDPPSPSSLRAGKAWKHKEKCTFEKTNKHLISLKSESKGAKAKRSARKRNEVNGGNKRSVFIKKKIEKNTT
jgi:hypothetical protein